MESRDPTGLTPAEGRRFALTVGVAFLVFAALFLWRGYAIPLWIAASLGGGLVLAGLTVPGSLGPVWRAWMGMARAISKVTNPLVMGLIYYLAVTPTGLLRRLFGGNPLKRRDEAPSYWVPREDDGARRDMHRQF